MSEIEALREEVKRLTGRVGQLENLVEVFVCVEHTKRLSSPSLDEIIRRQVATFFSLSHHELIGVGEMNRPGPKLVATSHEFKLKVAREWMVILYLRFFPEWSQRKLEKHYTWLSERTYLSMRKKIKEVSQNENHPDREVWLNLMSRIAKEANLHEQDSTQAAY